MNEIMVSICCITYNHEKYIADAIEGFLMQKTDFNYEILIHDDASTDRTADIIRDYANKYPDIIKPILQTENQYSKGIKFISYKFNFPRSKGKYFAFCEGDDYWTDPCKLQKQIDYMENNPECSMCFHAAEIIDVEGIRVGVIKPYDKNCISTTEDIISGGGGFMATNSLLCRNDIKHDLPEFYFNSPVGDYPLQILSSMKKYSYYINEYMSVYRVGVEGSWSDRMASGKNIEERFISHNKALIEMLNEFNEYSGGKYCDAINKRILKNEFTILKLQRDVKQMKSKKYKPIYDSLTMKQKIKVHFWCCFPNVYKRLSIIKRYIVRFMLRKISYG